MIGAAPHERTETRRNRRNGTRARLLSTKAGDVELRIPTLRKGSFFPSILERRRRIDRALFAVVMETYVHGVSTRKVDDLVAALGLEAGISRSEVSRICAELDESLEAFHTRPLGHVELPYVFCDATHVKGRVGGRVVSRAVVVATGITATADREVLGVDAGDSEDAALWTAFLRSLHARGLSEVQLVISDAHEGLLACAAFPVAHWRKIWSTNPLERLHKEIKRRTDVVGIFPSDDALIHLTTTVIAETHDEWTVCDRRYLSEATMRKLHQPPPEQPDPLPQSPEPAITAH